VGERWKAASTLNDDKDINKDETWVIATPTFFLNMSGDMHGPEVRTPLSSILGGVMVIILFKKALYWCVQP
jgi:hypothetical protein